MPFTQAEKAAIKLMRAKGLADVEAKYGPDAVIESINVNEDEDGTVHITVRYREDVEL